MNLFPEGEGNTPLSADEQADLLPNLATKEELNEWERQNILEAHMRGHWRQTIFADVILCPNPT